MFAFLIKLKQRLLWHHLYFLLAIINLTTIAAALILSNQIMSIYQVSVETNKQMSSVVSEFIKLNHIVKEAREPAIRIFESNDIEFEQESLRQSKIWFDTSYKHSLKNFNSAFDDPNFIYIAQDLKQVQDSMSAMLLSTNDVFNAVTSKQIASAVTYLVQVDNHYYQLINAISNISHYLSEQQNQHFDQQVMNAQQIKLYQIILSVFTLCLVLFVSLYGHALGKRLKQNQKDLQDAAEKAEEISHIKSTFLANMSHEIRTPMNGIINLLKLIDDAPLKKQEQEYLALASSSTNNLMVIINDILDISKIEQGKLIVEQKNFDFVNIIDEQVRLHQSANSSSGMIIVTEYPKNIDFQVVGDSVRVSQVINNLLSNAIKFTRQGQVVIRLELITSPNNSEEVIGRAIVKDTGIGIPSDKISQVFKAFVQTDSSTTREYGGTGLGLPISKQLCQNMGGDLTATSELGVGSDFIATFSFKLGEKIQPYKKENIVKAIEPLEINLLVAEDNKVNQVVISALLDKFGCSYEIVDNGQKVLDLLSRNNEFDAILMDCLMPEMDGYQASREIRAGNAGQVNVGIPIVAVTANSMSEDIERCKKAGMNKHIAKPIVPEALYQALDTLQSDVQQEA